MIHQDSSNHRGRAADGAVGGPGRHTPVMLNEVLDHLRPASGEIFIDSTFGAGGYSQAILSRDAELIGIDRDPDAIAAGKELVEASQGRLSLVSGRFSDMAEIAHKLGHEKVDGIVLDIGVSSMQLDEAERGFSFRHDGPLDMRMEQAGPSAADIVNGADVSTLTRIFGVLGEERHAARIARAIEAQRQNAVFTTTGQLARLIERAIGKRPGERIHPATRSFQGLRIFVNNELEELARALISAENLLKPGGRLVVVSFHSLEDRIVKKFFAAASGSKNRSRHLPQIEAEEAQFTLPKKPMIGASIKEVRQNLRARSAKLRAGTRTAVLARNIDLEKQLAQMGVPQFFSSKTKPRSGKRRG